MLTSKHFRGAGGNHISREVLLTSEYNPRLQAEYHLAGTTKYYLLFLVPGIPRAGFY